MVVQIVQTVRINGRWFLEGDEYKLHSSFHSRNPDCLYDGIEYKELSGEYFKVVIGDVFYDVPGVCAALLTKEEPIGYGPYRIQELYKQRTKDVTAPMFGGHTDVVKQAKKFLGLNIASRSGNNVSVDQSRIRQLEEAKKRAGIILKPIGINGSGEKAESS